MSGLDGLGHPAPEVSERFFRRIGGFLDGTEKIGIREDGTATGYRKFKPQGPFDLTGLYSLESAERRVAEGVWEELEPVQGCPSRTVWVAFSKVNGCALHVEDKKPENADQWPAVEWLEFQEKNPASPPARNHRNEQA